LAFPEPDTTDAEDEDENDTDDVENAELWNGLDEADQSQVDAVMDNLCVTRRMPCFAHTEQLVVGDGLKQLRCMRSLIGKCSRLSTVLHTSSAFTDQFEETFGTSTSIPSENVTRWHSTLRQLRSIIELDQ